MDRKKWLFLKHGFGGCGHGLGVCDGLGGFDGFDGLGGFSGFDGFSVFDGFGGFGKLSRLFLKRRLILLLLVAVG